MISPSRICVLCLVLVLASTSEAGRKRTIPKRCCSPEKFTVDVKNTAASHKYDSRFLQPEAKLSYDYPNRRYAVYQKQQNSTDFVHFMFDHKEGVKMARRSGMCKVTTNTGLMAPHCIQSNATFDGTYTLGYKDLKYKVNQWTYDFGLIPARVTKSVTHKGCWPVKEITGSAVQNSYSSEKGNDPCVPWEDPRQVIKGKCYKSFKKTVVKKSVIEFTAVRLNLDYRGMKLEIEPDLFQIPADCDRISREEWDQDVVIKEEFVQAYLWRFNPHNPFI